MSTLKVDSIQDKAGTGAPDFPNGVSLSGGSDALTSYEEYTSSISSGDFTGGSIKIVKVGNHVTLSLTAPLTHASLSSPASATGLIPSQFRPIYTSIVSKFSSLGHEQMYVTDSGQIGGDYRNYSGALYNRTSLSALTISYTV